MVPLAIAPGDDPDQADSHNHYGLEFEYDCDAPKCRIDVNVILPADHPLAENVDSRGFSRILVFRSVVDGGFGKFLKLEEGATLELGRFEQSVRSEDFVAEKPSADAQATGPAAASRNGRQRKRFTAFHFGKRSSDRAASGPALAVVDADAANTSTESEKDKGSKDDMCEGVRATIRLSALDEDGTDVPTVNEQTTYLHIVRMGTPPTADEEDVRPWVVKVIKREATVGVYYPLFWTVLSDLADWPIHVSSSRDLRSLRAVVCSNPIPTHLSPKHGCSYLPTHYHRYNTCGWGRTLLRVPPLPFVASRGYSPSMSPSCRLQGMCDEYG